MYDVELRGEGLESFPISPLPPPEGFHPSAHHHHLQHVLNLSHEGWLSPKYGFPSFQILPFPCSKCACHGPSPGFAPGTSAAVAWLLIWCSDPPGDPF